MRIPHHRRDLSTSSAPTRPKNQETTRSKRAYLCVHMPTFSSLTFPPPPQSFWVPQANQTVVISATKTPQISGALNTAVQITARLSSYAREASDWPVSCSSRPSQGDKRGVRRREQVDKLSLLRASWVAWTGGAQVRI